MGGNATKSENRLSGNLLSEPFQATVVLHHGLVSHGGKSTVSLLGHRDGPLTVCSPWSILTPLYTRCCHKELNIWSKYTNSGVNYRSYSVMHDTGISTQTMLSQKFSSYWRSSFWFSVLSETGACFVFDCTFVSLFLFTDAMQLYRWCWWTLCASLPSSSLECTAS